MLSQLGMCSWLRLGFTAGLIGLSCSWTKKYTSRYHTFLSIKALSIGMGQQEGVDGLGWCLSDSSNLLSFTLSTHIVLSPRRDYTPLGLSIDTWNKLKRTKKKIKAEPVAQLQYPPVVLVQHVVIGLVGWHLHPSCRLSLLAVNPPWLITPSVWFDRVVSGPLGCSMRRCASTWHHWVWITAVGFTLPLLVPTIVPHHWLPLAIIRFKLLSLGWICHSEV